MIGCVLTVYEWIYLVQHNFLKYLGREAKVGNWPVMLTMSFRRQDVRSHPWVRRLWGDPFGNQQGSKIDHDQIAEDTVILLSQSSCISFRISNQFRNFDIRLEGFSVDRLQLSVLDSLWGGPTMVEWYLEVSSNRKVVKTKSEVNTERALHSVEKIIRSREWPWMWVGKSTYWWRSKDSKIPDSCPASNDEESVKRLKSPISARSGRSVGM